MMREKLEALDEFLISQVFEKLAHWTQRMFGFHCFNWARVSVIGSFLSIGVFILYASLTLMLLPVPYFLKTGLALCYLAMLLPIWWSNINKLLLVKLLEIVFLSDGHNPPTANNMRIAGRSSRINNLFFTGLIVACFLIVGTIEGTFPLVAGWLLLQDFYGYFIACTPLPPGTSKVREFLNAFKRIRVLVPLPSPSAS